MSSMKNRFGHNMTGGQIDRIFARLIRDVLTSLAHTAQFLDREVATIIAYLVKEKRCKPTLGPKEVCIQHLMLAVSTPHDRSKMVDRLMKAQLERTVWLIVFGQLETLTNDYLSMYRRWVTTRSPFVRESLHNRLAEIEADVGLTRDSGFAALTEFKINHDRLAEFKNNIQYQYSNLSHSLGQRFAAASSNVSLDDLHQNMMESISNGINKYSSRSGAPSRYVKYWIVNAYSNPSHQNGLAYDIPPSVKAKMAKGTYSESNFGVSLEAPLSSDNGDTTLADVLPGDIFDDPQHVVQRETVHRQVAYCTKLADPTGVYRLVTGVSEVFTPAEYEQMANSMLNHKTAAVTIAVG